MLRVAWISYADQIGKEARKGPSAACCTIEQGLSVLRLVSTIPESDIVNEAGIETALCHPKEETSDEQATEVLDKPHQRLLDTRLGPGRGWDRVTAITYHDYSPADHDGWQTDRGL